MGRGQYDRGQQPHLGAPPPSALRPGRAAPARPPAPTRALRAQDGPHNCFLGGGNEIAAVGCTHEGNLIEHCAYEASDTGAWYSCGQHGAWTNRGNVAVRNTFRDIRCRIHGRSVEGCGGGVQAVYLDDQMSGWRWEANVFDDCDTGFFVGGGRSTVAHSNSRQLHQGRALCPRHELGRVHGQRERRVPRRHGRPRRPRGRAVGVALPELLAIRKQDHLCVPVYNNVSANTYADVSTFIDASAKDIAAWLSVVEGNVNVTRVRHGALVEEAEVGCAPRDGEIATPLFRVFLTEHTVGRATATHFLRAVSWSCHAR